MGGQHQSCFGIGDEIKEVFLAENWNGRDGQQMMEENQPQEAREQLCQGNAGIHRIIQQVQE